MNGSGTGLCRLSFEISAQERLLVLFCYKEWGVGEGLTPLLEHLFTLVPMNYFLLEMIEASGTFCSTNHLKYIKACRSPPINVLTDSFICNTFGFDRVSARRGVHEFRS
jgi:hypothetical protein